MIVTRRLKNVIFFQAILGFVLSREIINDLARKHGNVTVEDFCKYEKLEYKKRLKLDMIFYFIITI